MSDLLDQDAKPGDALWLISWGFDVPQLVRRLIGRPMAYHAHSVGYGFDLPPGLPVIAVSRNTLGYWGNRTPRILCSSFLMRLSHNDRAGRSIRI